MRCCFRGDPAVENSVQASKDVLTAVADLKAKARAAFGASAGSDGLGPGMAHVMATPALNQVTRAPPPTHTTLTGRHHNSHLQAPR